MIHETNLLAGKRAMGRETITIDNTSGGVGFTAATIKPTSGDFKGVKATLAIVQSEGSGQIRYTDDGTAPTTSVGTIINPYEEFPVVGSTNITKFRAIRMGGVNGTINVAYYFG
jgi:hypothetical protein